MGWSELVTWQIGTRVRHHSKLIGRAVNFAGASASGTEVLYRCSHYGGTLLRHVLREGLCLRRSVSSRAIAAAGVHAAAVFLSVLHRAGGAPKQGAA